MNAERLEHFLDALARRHRYAFELRNPTWHSESAYRILRKYNVAFSIFEIGESSECHITANFTYVRLHGPGGPHQGSYSDAQLRTLLGFAPSLRPDRRNAAGRSLGPFG